jgi:hypothetical protein
MTIPFALTSDVFTAYRVQDTHGTLAPNDASARVLEANAGTGLALTKRVVSGNAIRPSLAPLRPRHGARSAGGPLSADLQVLAHDPLFEAAFRATYSAPLVLSGLTLQYTQATGILLRSDGGSFLTDGVRVGDTYRFNGAMGVNANIAFMVASVNSGTSLTVANRMDLATGGTITGVTMTRGKKLLCGAAAPVLREFSIEHWESINSNCERFIDARMASFGLNMPAEGAVTMDMQFVCTDKLARTTGKHFTNAVQNTNPFLVTADAVVMFAGARIETLQSCTVSWDMSVSAPIPVGSRRAVNVFDGMTVPNVTFNFMKTDTTNLLAFENESGPFSAAIMFREPGVTGGYVTIGLPSFTLGSATPTDRIGNSGAQIEAVTLNLGVGSGTGGVDAALFTLCTAAAV